MKNALTAVLVASTLWMPFGLAGEARADEAVMAGGVGDTGGEVAEQAFEISGDLSEMFVSGEILIYSRDKKGASGGASGGGGGGMMMAASSMSAAGGEASSDGPAGPGTVLVGRAELVDGKFRIVGEVDEVKPVYFHISDGVDHEGHHLGPVKGQMFILEPGELVMTMGPGYDWVVTGPYNDKAINSWKQSPGYQEPWKALKALASAGDDGMSAEEKNKRIVDLQKQFLDYEFESRAKLATTDPDMKVRELAVTTTYIIGDWAIEGARSVLKEDPSNAWAKKYVADYDARRAKIESEGVGVNVGDYAQFFDAQTLGGEEVSLRDVCGDSRYVLLEFWASWCGPCRAEIPNMKKAYGKYHGSGFEIFSFTIDDSKEAWAKASKTEELPWIDSGFGSESKPKKMYRVTGVPNNYLIDCKTGKVIAKNLRGKSWTRS
ncbi:MAG: TlpA disulfide reductase family protein [Phycisphaerales bacterium]